MIGFRASDFNSRVNLHHADDIISILKSLCKEDVQKLLDLRGRFDSRYREPSTSGIPGMKRRS